MLLLDLVHTSQRVAETSARRAKLGLLADLLRRAAPDESETVIAFLSGSPRQKRMGVGYATLQAARPARPADTATLQLAEVDVAFERLARASGKGSAQARQRLLHDLFVRSTTEEQDFLFRLLIGELRQGALEGLMSDAVAQATGLGGPAVRRATMMAGDLGPVAKAALSAGAAGLAQFDVELFRPMQPMLAQSADDVAEALERLGEAGIEYKVDGARIQVHKRDRDVRVFSRLLNDVTAAVPEVVDTVRGLAVREAILDGEAIALGPEGEGSFQPFQVTMRRFGRRLDVHRLKAELPLSSFFFDVLFAGERGSLLDQPYARRVEVLSEIVPAAHLVPRLVTARVDEAEAFLAQALHAGHEGVMVKMLTAGYDAGARGAAWLKVKPAHTLDLVVLAAEWGHGRRRGWLSNLHLGARDAEAGGFVMLGKTFKGMTDEMLTWQTEKLKELATSNDGHVVQVRPALVVEIAFNDLQESPHYAGGLALRFARVKRYRTDKTPDQADTMAEVRALAQRQRGKKPIS